ncbi:MAG: hypothetical protein EOO38_27655 [Cytophagaceae bacterium]|nr:MAG: hypothetical protein EOO38_27655 [Cytophagaceae bacterium]
MASLHAAIADAGSVRTELPEEAVGSLFDTIVDLTTHLVRSCALVDGIERYKEFTALAQQVGFGDIVAATLPAFLAGFIRRASTFVQHMQLSEAQEYLGAESDTAAYFGAPIDAADADQLIKSCFQASKACIDDWGFRYSTDFLVFALRVAKQCNQPSFTEQDIRFVFDACESKAAYASRHQRWEPAVAAFEAASFIAEKAPTEIKKETIFSVVDCLLEDAKKRFHLAVKRDGIIAEWRLAEGQRSLEKAKMNCAKTKHTLPEAEYKVVLSLAAAAHSCLELKRTNAKQTGTSLGVPLFNRG